MVLHPPIAKKLVDIIDCAQYNEVRLGLALGLGMGLGLELMLPRFLGSGLVHSRPGHPNPNANP